MLVGLSVLRMIIEVILRWWLLSAFGRDRLSVSAVICGELKNLVNGSLCGTGMGVSGVVRF